MKRLAYILAAAICLSCLGCENEELVDPGEEHSELTVLQSEIHPDAVFPGLRITRTLPVGIPYDITKAEVKTAVVYLTIDGLRIVPLHYTQQGIYQTLYSLDVKQGQTIELFGQLGSQTFYSRTKIPVRPEVISSDFNSSIGCLEAGILARPGEVYSAIWGVMTDTDMKTSGFFNTSDPSGSLFPYQAKIRTAALPADFRKEAFKGRRFIKVFAFDQSFAAYFSSRAANAATDDPYTQNSGKIIWNVQGKNVIGMFLGVNESEFIPAD